MCKVGSCAFIWQTFALEKTTKNQHGVWGLVDSTSPPRRFQRPIVSRVLGITFLAPSKRSAFELGVSAERVEIVDEGVRGRVVWVETVALATFSTLRNIYINSSMHATCSFRCQPFWKR